MRRSEREASRILLMLHDVKRDRLALEADLAELEDKARRLVPLARDAGASVARISRALGISRPGVYALMQRGKNE